MVLRRISQSLKVSMALIVAMFSTGLMPLATAYAIPAGAINDTYTVAEDGGATTFDVLANDTGDSPEITSTSIPSEGGIATVHPNKKSVVYTPAANYSGNETFTYTITVNETVGTGRDKTTTTTNSTATVSVTVEEDEDPGVVEEVLVVSDQTCDDVTTPGANGWTVKYNEGYPDTVEYTAPSGYLVDKYCVKAGSTQQGNGPIIVPVNPPTSTVTIDYPAKDSISHYVVHLIPNTAQTVVSPVAPTLDDVCGTADDSFTLPTDTAQVTYTRNGDVVTATLVNPSTHDFGAPLNGYTVAVDGVTATMTVSFTSDPCLSPTPCPTPTNGGAITQNSANWELVGDAEFVDGAVSISSANWVDGGVSYSGSYSLKDVQNLAWSLNTTDVTGAYGVGILLTLSTGETIHYEPGTYTDDFWSNQAVLPANGGGQGGPYSGSLQDALNTIGNATITKTTFVFTSANVNENVMLTQLSFSCTNYTFNKAGQVQGDNDKKIEICHATSSVVNPYNKISVSEKAADGLAGNSGGQPDHYGEHTGPIFDPTTNRNGDEWGDIIPPVPGVHEGRNWTAQGQAIYNNGDCVYVSPTDACPTVPGLQSDTTLCPAGQVRGLQTGGGQGGGNVLGAAKSVALPAVLPATGANGSLFTIITASLLAYGAAYFLQGRRMLAKQQA